MPKFAVYYILEKEHPLYNLGSQLLGYDLRAEKEIPFHQILLNNYPKKQIENWIGKARKYGFHLTIGDAIDFEKDKLCLLKDKLSALIQTLDHSLDWTLRLGNFNDIRENLRIGRGGACLIEYQANWGVKELHRLVCTEINVLGTGSGYKDKIKNPKWNSEQIIKIQKYFSPYILDEYAPHFTFMNPFFDNGSIDNDWLLDFLSTELNTLANINEIKVKTICLMIQDNPDDYWRIEEEFIIPN